MNNKFGFLYELLYIEAEQVKIMEMLEKCL